MTDRLPFFETDFTAETVGRVNRKFVHTVHGNAKRVHKADSARLSWSYGKLAHSNVRAACGTRIYSPSLTDALAAGLMPCPRCFPVSVSFTTTKVAVSINA